MRLSLRDRWRKNSNLDKLLPSKKCFDFTREREFRDSWVGCHIKERFIKFEAIIFVFLLFGVF